MRCLCGVFLTQLYSWPYGPAADCYSFGILLWEAVALEQPFATHTPQELEDLVMKWGERPKLKEGWPQRVVDLMTRAWDANFRKRPTMREMEEMLEMEVKEVPA